MPVTTLPKAKGRTKEPTPTRPAIFTAPLTAGLPDLQVTVRAPKQELQACLDKLNALYLQPNPRDLPEALRKITEWADRTAHEAGTPQVPYSRRFPSADELKELSACIEKVAKKMGIKKISIPFLYGVIKHIDSRYPKLGVQDFVAKLVRKITALAAPISTQTHKRTGRMQTGRYGQKGCAD